MTHTVECKCKKVATRKLKYFDASGILGAPFPVIMNSGVTEKFCGECGKIVSHIIAKPNELIAAAAVLRATNPMRLSGSDIKFLRNSLGLKSKELADEISVKAETLSRFENDKQPMSKAPEKLLRAVVCLRHIGEVRSLDVDISGLFSIWPVGNKAIHIPPDCFSENSQGVAAGG